MQYYILAAQFPKYQYIITIFTQLGATLCVSVSVLTALGNLECTCIEDTENMTCLILCTIVCLIMYAVCMDCLVFLAEAFFFKKKTLTFL